MCDFVLLVVSPGVTLVGSDFPVLNLSFKQGLDPVSEDSPSRGRGRDGRGVGSLLVLATCCRDLLRLLLKSQ